MAKKIVKSVSGAMLGMALCFSSTIASAANAPVASAHAPMSISPFVALSAYGTMQSRSAVCATAVGAAGAAAAGQVAPGCVLPVLDPVAPVVVETAPLAPVEIAPVAASGFGLGIGALLAGLVLVAGLAAVLLSSDEGGTLPLSPF
ncbi:MAG: hypothetical protein H7X91_13280 [Burkholderiales bacterium]|nr:hypothetical protein [Burkholderiales bacterium]